VGVGADGEPSEARGDDARDAAREAGRDAAPGEPREPGRPSHDVVGDLVGTRGRIAVGVVFFVLYTLTFGLRGNLLAGLVGGALGGVVFFLLLKEAEQRRRRRRQG
jgi:hypothetical protein